MSVGRRFFAFCTSAFGADLHDSLRSAGTVLAAVAAAVAMWATVVAVAAIYAALGGTQ